jgi:quinol monooxygenase YgiN
VIVELARVRTTDPEAFGRNVQASADVLTADAECQGVRVLHCIERPDEFVLEVTWASVQAHERFRAGQTFSEYRSHIQDLFAAPPEFAHYAVVAEAKPGDGGPLA